MLRKLFTRTLRKSRASKLRDGVTQLRLEHLEARKLMAANITAILDPISKVLQVEGTPGNDTIEVRNNNGTISIANVQIKNASGAMVGQLPFGQTILVEVKSLGGNDKIRMVETNVTSQKQIGLDAYGGDGIDFIVGGSAEDHLFGEGNDDWILGRGGMDRLWGGPGNDMLSGGADDDFLHGESDNDELFGGQGRDQLFGDAGSDRLYAMGGSGENTVGGSEDDLLADMPTFTKQLVGDFNGDGKDDLAS
ncbi:MAG: calcium-binding protein [Pirellulales bacterium]